MLGTDEHDNTRYLSGQIALVDSNHGGDPPADTRKSTFDLSSTTTEALSYLNQN